MEKKCAKCGVVKILDEFHKGSSPDGHHSQCKECAIAGAKADYYRRKETILPAMALFYKTRREQIRLAVCQIKQELGCCLCDEDDPCCLDCHHLGDKSDEVAYLVSKKTIKRLVVELNKCVCVCSNCHRKLHYTHYKT